MIQALFLHLHTGAMRRVQSTLTSLFSTDTPMLEVVPKPRDSTMKTGKIHAGGRGVQ
jgi:hypothetical protein